MLSLDLQCLAFRPRALLPSLSHPHLRLIAGNVIVCVNLPLQTLLTVITALPNQLNWEFWFLDFSLACGKTICLAFLYTSQKHTTKRAGEGWNPGHISLTRLSAWETVSPKGHLFLDLTKVIYKVVFALGSTIGLWGIIRTSRIFSFLFFLLP